MLTFPEPLKAIPQILRHKPATILMLTEYSVQPRVASYCERSSDLSGLGEPSGNVTGGERERTTPR